MCLRMCTLSLFYYYLLYFLSVTSLLYKANKENNFGFGYKKESCDMNDYRTNPEKF